MAELAFDEPDVARARSFLGFFGGELDPLTFAQQLEHGPSHRTTVEKVFDAAFVADESEPFVD